MPPIWRPPCASRPPCMSPSGTLAVRTAWVTAASSPSARCDVIRTSDHTESRSDSSASDPLLTARVERRAEPRPLHVRSGIFQERHVDDRSARVTAHSVDQESANEKVLHDPARRIRSRTRSVRRTSNSRESQCGCLSGSRCEGHPDRWWWPRAWRSHARSRTLD